MVSLRRALIAPAALALGAACQAIVGVEDKTLDPMDATGAGGVGGAVEGGDTADTGTPAQGTDPKPPERPTGPAVPAGGATRWFAAKTTFLGTYDPVTKTPDSTAWRRIGHDLDGECTTNAISKSNSSTICARQPSAPEDTLEDGDQCRDNAAGKLLAVGIKVLPSNFESELHAKMAAGESATFLLKLEDLETKPGVDDPYVRGSLFVSVPRNPAFDPLPKWDGTDVLVVDQRTVQGAEPSEGGADASVDAGTDAKPSDAASDGDAKQPVAIEPIYVFDTGYLKDDVWVSGDFGNSPMKMPLFVLKTIKVVDLATMTLAVQLTPARDQAVSSLLSAVATTESLETYFRPISIEIAACSPVLGNLLMDTYLLPGRDLGPNPPTFQTPGKPCDAMSFGFAFEWVGVQPPVSVGLPAAAPPPCGDGGL